MEQQNIIKRVLEWNKRAGNKPPALGEMDPTLNSMDKEALRCEVNMIGTGYINSADEQDVLKVDEAKMAEALGDVVFHAVEAIRRLGLDPEIILEFVCDANDSKLATNPDEIRKATEFLKKKRIAFTTETLDNGLSLFRSSMDQRIDNRQFLKGQILQTPCHSKAETAISEYLSSLKKRS